MVVFVWPMQGGRSLLLSEFEYYQWIFEVRLMSTDFSTVTLVTWCRITLLLIPNSLVDPSGPVRDLHPRFSKLSVLLVNASHAVSFCRLVLSAALLIHMTLNALKLVGKNITREWQENGETYFGG